jgi:hypothetical protein
MHSAEQVAIGGTTLQLVSHRAEQLALHCPMQVVMLPEDMHELVQSPVQLALQSVLHSASPGVAVQLAMQAVLQLPVQLAETEAMQLPVQPTSRFASHATCRLGGEHAASHPPLTMAVHDSLPLKTAPPQSEKMSARAEPAANVTIAPATRARSEDQRTMRTSRWKTIFDETSPVENSFNTHILARPLRRIDSARHANPRRLITGAWRLGGYTCRAAARPVRSPGPSWRARASIWHLNTPLCRECGTRWLFGLDTREKNGMSSLLDAKH